MEEIWKEVQGYEEFYCISNLGRLKRKPIVYYRKTDGRKCTLKEKIVAPFKNKKGYNRVRLEKFGLSEKFTTTLHILVAKHFIPNPNNYTQVNHIDGNKDNNSISNLEWINNQENVLHSYRNENMLHGKAKAIIQCDENGNEITRFQTLKQAEEETSLKLDSRYMDRAIKNNTIYKGFKWKAWDRKLESTEGEN